MTSRDREAANAVTTMRLCERFHLTPQELSEIDHQTIADWLTIASYEADIRKADTPNNG